MVNANATALARETRQMLDGRDIKGLAAVAIGAGGGLIVAQRLTDRVMAMLDMSVEPQSAMEFGASIAIKVGLALIGLAFAALGSLASAGVDVVVGLLTIGRGASGQQRREVEPEDTSSPSDTSSSSPSPSASRQAATPTVGGV